MAKGSDYDGGCAGRRRDEVGCASFQLRGKGCSLTNAERMTSNSGHKSAVWLSGLNIAAAEIAEPG
ncbi:hypothetical protein J2S88_003553 [Agrobacterium tumefaciens]|jgi:hypothetical protein|uniref:Uncharacterized protein n=1 Tax=Agrobacterium tumefaciens TaxID=358 RepID=A0AAW8M299_AGRTU|nr:hypothetical protein [Agrobacterium tumefaciens]MBP2536482.1 hypothetical protein [Agrobacterium tumefaciens]MBP2542068.1 hypothetical protein [Agrobacterium tumefaciens]MBP2568448.1 hypothetical protein [Agrobacterium tumefaciens]MBP2573840.1 hypothetical protein [Agrobacterium tumefaciens]